MRALIIGAAGHMGRRRAKTLGQLGFDLALDDKVDIQFLCDELRAENLRGNFFLSGEVANVCLICTPPDSHLELATQAAAAGMNVFIEKPLSDSFNEIAITALVQALQNNSVWGMMGNSYRFLPSLREFRKRFVDYPVLAAEIWAGQHLADWHPGEDYKNSYSARIGVAYESLSHSLDLANWLFGDFGSICALGNTTRQITDRVENATCLIDAKSGAHIVLHVDYWQRPRDMHINVVCAKEGETRFSWQFDPAEADVMYRKEMEAMKRALEIDLQPQPDIYQGISILQWIDAAERSSVNARWEKSDDLWQKLARRTQ